MKQEENELTVKVRKGIKVKIVEASEKDNLGDRDIQMNANKGLKIEVHRIDGNDLGNAASKIAMCG